MALPKIAIIPTGGTIQNGQPLVSSSKAGGEFNLLRPQRLHEPVSVKIAKEDLDGNPLTTDTSEDPYWNVTLDPSDGLYLLPPMTPDKAPPEGYAAVHMNARRIIEEIDRFGLDTAGRNGLLAEAAQLEVREIIDPRTGRELRAGGQTFSMFELVLISNAVNEALAESDTTGCVVTHGTFTAEETACFLHYTVNSDKPVVVAASQRRHSSMSNDGDWNLVDAVRVAAHPDAKGRGAMLVMNEEIMSAREVTKTNQRPGGFASSGGSASALGSVESDQVTFYFRPERKHTRWSDVRSNGPLPDVMPRVDIVKTYAGADEVPIAALIDRALKERSTPGAPQKHGIVVEGFAYDGKPHQFQLPILQTAMYQHGMPVAVSNRGDHGRVPRLVDNPFISCDNMMAVKARLLLILAIEKLGTLTPFASVDNPSSEDRQRLELELSRYQEIFDTH